MVEYTQSLDNIFSSLADPTRRDILSRVARQEMSIGEIAQYYNLTFAAISKHLKVLERSKLVTKKRRGKEQMVSVAPSALKEVDDYLETYHQLWEARFDRLETLLKEDNK
jgi:DNA-binding transcriptional ArsR family regulator